MKNLKNLKNFKAGDLYWMNEIGPRVGREQKKRRVWALIRCSSYCNMLWQVAPLITESEARRGREHEEWIRTSGSGKDYIVALSQITTVDLRRFSEFAGRLTESELKEVYEKMLALYQKEVMSMVMESGA